jgi:hypothetical protein
MQYIQQKERWSSPDFLGSTGLTTAFAIGNITSANALHQRWFTDGYLWASCYLILRKITMLVALLVITLLKIGNIFSAALLP